MVLCCCSPSTCWLVRWHALSGIRISITASCSTGTWQHQAMIPWHKNLPKAPVITSVNPCVLQLLLRRPAQNYEPCLYRQPGVVLLSKETCTNSSLCWFLHLILPPSLRNITTSQAERLTKMLISKIMVSTVGWESSFNRDCSQSLVLSLACCVSRDKPWNSSSLSVKCN